MHQIYAPQSIQMDNIYLLQECFLNTPLHHFGIYVIVITLKHCSDNWSIDSLSSINYFFYSRNSKSDIYYKVKFNISKATNEDKQVGITKIKMSKH